MSDEQTTPRDDEPADDGVGRRILAGLTHQVPRDAEGGEGRASLLAGLVFSWLGFVGYQFFLYPVLPILSDTSRRIGWICIVLALAVIVRPRLHALLLVLLGWGLVLVVIAVDSALPVGLVDLEPQPSFTLYAAHLVLASAQVPLVASAWGRLWPGR